MGNAAFDMNRVNQRLPKFPPGNYDYVMECLHNSQHLEKRVKSTNSKNCSASTIVHGGKGLGKVRISYTRKNYAASLANLLGLLKFHLFWSLEVKGCRTLSLES